MKYVPKAMNIDYTKEIWKRIEVAPSYAVSNHGRIARVAGGQGARHLIRKQDLEATGYLRVRVSEGGVQMRLSVHRLVAIAFLGAPPSDAHQVAHYDNDKTNNHYTNLRWATAKENIADKQRHGTQARGDTCGRSKISSVDVAAIRANPASHQVMANKYGLSRNHVYRIRKGRNWTHI